jgi:predicted phage gp36 major capsid-like protein
MRLIHSLFHRSTIKDDLQRELVEAKIALHASLADRESAESKVAKYQSRIDRLTTTLANESLL